MMPLQRVRSTIVASSTFTLLAVAASVAAEPPPRARVDQIAAMLDSRPSGLGRACADRRAWQKLARNKGFRSIVATAEELLEEPLPEQSDELFLDYSRTGNRERWQRVAFARRGRIRTLVLAECVEDEGRFLPAIEEVVRAVCAEKTWVYPAHDWSLHNFRQEQIDIDLGSSALAGELGLTSYLLGDKLSRETRSLIDTRVHTLVLDPFRAMVLGTRDPNWWLTCKMNWNSVCLAGITVAALSLEEDRAERALYIAAAEQYSKNFLSGFTPDGYCSEGLGYWNYGFGRYAILAIAIERATHGGVDLLEVEGARSPARFGSRVEIVAGVYPSFADCPMNTKPDRALMACLNRRLGLTGDDGRGNRIASTCRSLAEVLAFTAWEEAVPTSRKSPATADSPLRTWFEDAGVLICRPSQGVKGRLGVAIKGGHNDEHHNHNDVGSFIVVAGDRPVLADPGTEVYTARTFSARRYESKVLNSFGHPVPVAAGKLQRTGREAQARVLRKEFTDERDTLVLDLRSAYDVPTLERLEREFQYERGDADRLTVIDRVEFSSPESFEVALVTHGTWSRPAPDVLRVDCDGRRVDVRLDGGGAEYSITSEQIDEDVRTSVKPTRIAIKLNEPVRSATLTMRITLADAEPKP